MINGNTLIIILCIIIIVLIYIHYKKTESYTLESIDFSWRNGKVDGVTKWILVGEFPSLEGDGTRTITKEYTDPSVLKSYTDVSVNFLKDTLFDYKISSGNIKLTLYYNKKGINNKVAVKEFALNENEGFTLKKSQLTKVDGPVIEWDKKPDNLPEEGWYQIVGGIINTNTDGKKSYGDDYYYYVDDNNKVKTAGTKFTSTNYIQDIQLNCSTLFYLSYKDSTKDGGKSGNFNLQTVMGQKIDSDALKWCIIGEDKSITCSKKPVEEWRHKWYGTPKHTDGVFKVYTVEKGEESLSNQNEKLEVTMIGNSPYDGDGSDDYCQVGHVKRTGKYCESDGIIHTTDWGNKDPWDKKTKYHNHETDISCHEDEDFPNKKSGTYIDNNNGSEGKLLCNVSETATINEGIRFKKIDTNTLDSSITLKQIYEAQDWLGLPRFYNPDQVDRAYDQKFRELGFSSGDKKSIEARRVLKSIHGFINGICEPKKYRDTLEKRSKLDVLTEKYGHIVKGLDLPIGLQQVPKFYIHIPPNKKIYKNQGSNSKILINENKLKITSNESDTKHGVSGEIKFPLTNLVSEEMDRSIVLVFSTTNDVKTHQTLIKGEFVNLSYPSSLNYNSIVTETSLLNGGIGIKDGKLLVSGKDTGIDVDANEWHIMIITQKQISTEKSYNSEVGNDNKRDEDREFRVTGTNSYKRYTDYRTKVKLITDGTYWGRRSHTSGVDEWQMTSDITFKEKEVVLEYTIIENAPKIMYPAIPDKITTVSPCKGGLVSSFAYFDVTLTQEEIGYLSDYYKTKNVTDRVKKTGKSEDVYGTSPYFRPGTSSWKWNGETYKLTFKTTLLDGFINDSGDYNIMICYMGDDYTADELGLPYSEYRTLASVRELTPVKKLKYKIIQSNITSSVGIEDDITKEMNWVTTIETESMSDWIETGTYGFMAIIAPRVPEEYRESEFVGSQIAEMIDDTVLVKNFVNDNKILTTNIIHSDHINSAKYKYDVYTLDNFSTYFKGVEVRSINYLKDKLGEGILEYGYIREEHNDRNFPEVVYPVKVPVYNETEKKTVLSDDKNITLLPKDDVKRYTSEDSIKALNIWDYDGNKIFNSDKTGIPENKPVNAYGHGEFPFIIGNENVYSYDGYHRFKWDDALKTEPMFSVYSDIKLGKGIVLGYLHAGLRINLKVTEKDLETGVTNELYKTDYYTFFKAQEEHRYPALTKIKEHESEWGITAVDKSHFKDTEEFKNYDEVWKKLQWVSDAMRSSNNSFLTFSDDKNKMTYNYYYLPETDPEKENHKTQVKGIIVNAVNKARQELNKSELTISEIQNDPFQDIVSDDFGEVSGIHYIQQYKTKIQKNLNSVRDEVSADLAKMWSPLNKLITDKNGERSAVRSEHTKMWQALKSNLENARHVWQILPFNVDEPVYTKQREVWRTRSATMENFSTMKHMNNEDEKLLNNLRDADKDYKKSSFTYVDWNKGKDLPERKPVETLYPINDVGDNPVKPLDRRDGTKAHEAFRQGQYGSSVSISGDIMVIGAPNTGKGKKMTLKVKDGTTNVIEFDEDGKRNDVLTTKEIYEYPDSGAAFIMKRDDKDGEWYNIGIVKGGNAPDKTGSAVSVDKGYIAITSTGDNSSENLHKGFNKDHKPMIDWAIENMSPATLPRGGVTESSLRSEKKYKKEFTNTEKVSPWEETKKVRNVGNISDDAWSRKTKAVRKNNYFGFTSKDGRKIYADKDGVRYFDGEYEFIDETRTYFTKEEKNSKPWKLALERLPWSTNDDVNTVDKKYSGYKNANGIRLWKGEDGFIRNYDEEGKPLVEDVMGEYHYSVNYLPEEKQGMIIDGYRKHLLENSDNLDQTNEGPFGGPFGALTIPVTPSSETMSLDDNNAKGSVGFLRVNGKEIEFIGDSVFTDGGTNKGFGTSVSISVFKSGSVFAAVGAPNGNENVSDKVFIYRKSRTGKRFVLIKTIEGPDKLSKFGASVSITQSVMRYDKKVRGGGVTSDYAYQGKLVVGAPDTNNGKGAVYIYSMNLSNYYDWGVGKMLVPNENDVRLVDDDEYKISLSLEEGDNYGASVSISNGVMAIGAPGKGLTYETGSSMKLDNIGIVYVYNEMTREIRSTNWPYNWHNKWSQSIIIPPIKAENFDNTNYNDEEISNMGTGGVTWGSQVYGQETKRGKYNASDYQYTDLSDGSYDMGSYGDIRFGSSVSVDDGKLAVGAPYSMSYTNYNWEEKERGSKNYTGTVTTYTRNINTGEWDLDQWYQDVLGQAESIGIKSMFGASVDVDASGNQLAVGVPGYTPFYNRKENTGRAMVYNLSNRGIRELNEDLCYSMVRFVDKDNQTEKVIRSGPWKNYASWHTNTKGTILKNNERIGVIDDETEYMTIYGSTGIGTSSCDPMMPNTPKLSVPTFKHEVSVYMKTVTFKFTDVTNKNDQYSIQIERGNGNVLKTQKIGKEDIKEVDEKGKWVREWINGAWKWRKTDPTYKYINTFTLTHEETSYGTHTYFVKLIHTGVEGVETVSTSKHTLEIKNVKGRCLSDIDPHCGIKYLRGACKRYGILKNAFRDEDLEYVTVSSKDDEDNNKYESFEDASKALSKNSEILKKYKQKIMDIIEEPIKNSGTWLNSASIIADDGSYVQATAEQLYDDTGDWQPTLRYDHWHIREIYVKPENYMKDGKKYYYFDLYFSINHQYTKKHGYGGCNAETDTRKFVEPDITITPAKKLVTFDIKLRSMWGSYKVEATLKNIVDPDPYYTVSFHNKKGEQVASHTFKSSDTEVKMEWSESGSGTKEYTVKLNGTTSSTESLYYCGGGRKSRVCDL